MPTLLSTKPLGGLGRWALALSLVAVACRDVPEAPSPLRPEADLAVAPPPCGTVTTNTNLSGDCTGPLVVGANGITVNLGGHAVTCGPVPNPFDFTIGIEIFGQTNDHVTNGEVKNCFTGIEIAGGGTHELSNLNVHNHGRFGIIVAGSNNDIRNTTSSFNGFVFDGFVTFGFGVIVAGNSNKLGQLQVEHNGIVGIELDGANNLVTSSSVLGNNREDCCGIAIFGSNNTIDLSTTVSQSRLGIVVGNSTGNTIRATSAFQNSGGGILLASVTNTTIQSSDASNNGGPGIRLGSGATSNLITSNKAFGNGGFDLEDDNPACDSNTWKSNQFGTANQSCIN
jgi:parallel beta-helix repeat protein